MSKKDNELTRRAFMKAAGITGVASMAALSAGLPGRALAQDDANKAQPAPEMPTRLFGRSKIPVSLLSLGGVLDFTTNQVLLKKALDYGVTYWDTANGYRGGKSEQGIGMFFEKFPEARKKIFLVTKSGSRNTGELENHLNLSFERMKTDYIDLFFIHGVKNVSNELTDETKAWMEEKKKTGKIKLFGLSTHSNVETVLMDASKLGWIDGIMMGYNFSIMRGDKMKAAVDACHKAGIGLTAMKTQRGTAVSTGSDEEIELAGKFVLNGYTSHQAKIKAIWENERISAICSSMPNLTILSANVAAASDKTKLDAAQRAALNTYATATCSSYCAGCSNICDAAMGVETRVADVMRYLMYHRAYGDVDRARQSFAKLTAEVRARIASVDFSPAERVCPQKMAITKTMKEASQLFV